LSTLTEPIGLAAAAPQKGVFRVLRSFPPVRVAILPLLLASCSPVGPNWTKTDAFAPKTWFAATPKQPPPPPPASAPVAEPIDANWWNLLHDAELTSLENRVVAGNLNVRIASIRFAESRSQRRIAGADQFPGLQSDGSYTREAVSNKGVLSLFGGGGASSFTSLGSSANGVGGRSGGIPAQVATAATGTSIQPFNLYQYGFDASWEVDFWGRVRREVESADAGVEVSAETRRRAIQAQLAITETNIGTEKQSLSLTEDRFHGGLTTELDVANAAAQLASTQSQIPQLEQQQDEQINAISLLLGEGPQALRAELIDRKAIPPVPPRVPVGLPSELARRRPDIRQAEAQLHEATADVGVAVGDFYPKVTLDGSFGFQALQFKNLGSWGAKQYGMGPSFSLPIFEGGRLRATLELRKTQQQEAALSYQQTVLQAWHDVNNALTAYAAEQRRHDALAESAAQNRKALDLSRQRYRQGVADFLNVLDAERAVLQAELAVAQSTAQVSENMVQLYKALGGGWETSFPKKA
jgi:NodT family efflux transporter outer membrane factor (OMF) lipoprotein